MNRLKRSGGLLLCLFFSLLMNMKGLIPAAVLLLLHFWSSLSVWWAVGCGCRRLLYLIFWTAFIGWAGRGGSEKGRPNQNKNLYSVGNTAYKP